MSRYQILEDVYDYVDSLYYTGQDDLFGNTENEYECEGEDE